MAYGRIKHRRTHRIGAEHAVGITAKVYRNSDSDNSVLFGATACLAKRKGRSLVGGYTCGYGGGRSPQSALAKALKQLSGVVATRGGSHRATKPRKTRR